MDEQLAKIVFDAFSGAGAIADICKKVWFHGHKMDWEKLYNAALDLEGFVQVLKVYILQQSWDGE